VSTRSRGFTLLPIVLAMSIIAAVAYALNRAHGLNTRMSMQQADLERARYVAEAGLQALNYKVQVSGCIGYPTKAAPLGNSNFSGGTYLAYAGASTGSPVQLVATGTYNGASVTLTRSEAMVYEPREMVVIQPDASGGQDTYVVSAQERNFGGDSRLRIQSGSYYPLVKIDLSSLPPGTKLVPWYSDNVLQPTAVLSLYQYDINDAYTGSPVLNAYPISRHWVAGTRSGGGSANGATWSTSNGVDPWPTPGAGYGSPALASTRYESRFGWVNWDLSAAAEQWLNGSATNNGVWIVPTGGTVGNTSFYSSNESGNASLRPKLTLSVQRPCGARRIANLALAADAYLASSTDQTRNFGGALLMDVNQGTPERRVVLRFDVSSIPTGSVVKSANLRLYLRAVTAPTDLVKTVRAYYVMEPWVEGTLSGSGNADGATWVTRNGVQAWTIAGGYAYWSSILGTARDEASGASPLPGAFRQGWVAIDLTGMTQAWVDRKYANYGILLRSESSTDILEFDSREASSGFPPQLVVIYQ
jgi:hypothetical protein